VAVVAGGVAGLICFIGLSLLLHRRIFDPRIRLTSHRTDLAILIILWVQLVIGLSTLPASLHHVSEPHHHAAAGQLPARALCSSTRTPAWCGAWSGTSRRTCCWA
jgi:nitrate reductase gamma subunit